jgi:hypothetical protein
VALSARGVPSEPRSQPPYVESLVVQVQEGLVMATELVGSARRPRQSSSMTQEKGRRARR